MSSKYLIDHLRERCLARLEADWPTTLLGWDRREQKATVDTRYNPREHFPHPVLVIQLAHELSLDQLLPCAFYDLCRYGPRKIAAGASTIPSLLPPKVLSHSQRFVLGQRNVDSLRLHQRFPCRRLAPRYILTPFRYTDRC